MKPWQFNVLFFVGVGGAVVLIFGPEFGLHLGDDPTALTGLGAILTYVLTQRVIWTKHDRRRDREEHEDEGEEDDRE